MGGFPSLEHSCLCCESCHPIYPSLPPVMAPIDTLCLYAYHWRDISLDVIVRQEQEALIPIRNVYENTFPSLKRNVLSARLSKLGVRSHVLTEPYVSILKKMGLHVTGSSHYVKITDFVKICNYFKANTPENVVKFCFISSQLEVEEVLKSFNALDLFRVHMHRILS